MRNILLAMYNKSLTKKEIFSSDNYSKNPRLCNNHYQHSLQNKWTKIMRGKKIIQKLIKIFNKKIKEVDKRRKLLDKSNLSKANR